MKKEISSQLYAKAQKVMPGGVNSPVRAFNAVGGEPLFIRVRRVAQLQMWMAMSLLIMFLHGGP